ncbi:hypothetical protein [Prevotella sp.]|uniref:hypothetical protein n=1 Tax=Prevotella sp. TaxID=59823 RepID=UPI0027E2855A|nr:hypothetical protein [Prevotella sp.]
MRKKLLTTVALAMGLAACSSDQINPNDCSLQPRYVTPANTALFGDRKEDAPEHGST